MSGRVFAVVGPSGAGKDTLMEAARARCPGLQLIRRVITRPASAGGEDFEGISVAEFERRQQAGDFALHWQAHGLHYGIPATLDRDLAAGHVVMFNGSRAMLQQAQARYPELVVLHVNAPRDVLAARLLARGRESQAEIAARLERAERALPDGLQVVSIVNDGALDEAVQTMLDALGPVRA